MHLFLIKEDECKRGVKAVKKNSQYEGAKCTCKTMKKKQIRNMSLRLTAIKVKYTLLSSNRRNRISAAVQTMRHRLLKLSKKSAITQMPHQMTMAEVVLSENEQKQIRIDKLTTMQNAGKDPFEITRCRARLIILMRLRLILKILKIKMLS